MLLIFLIWVLAPVPNGRTGHDQAVQTSPDVFGATFHAKGAVNIRAGPSESSAVRSQLRPNDEVRVGPADANGWSPVYGVGPDTVGFVKLDLLSPGLVPPLEIASWNWYSDPDFGGSGAVIWTAVIRNNTDRYIDMVRVEFTSFDASGQVIDTDFGYATGLSPGGTSSVKGYATYFGREKRASLAIKP